MKQAGSYGFSFGGWAALGLAGAIVIAAAAGLLSGARPFTVLTGSMEPAISPGDVVIVRQIRPSEARVGQVISFTDPEGSGELITHRVRSMRSEGGLVAFRTRGDANNVSERWTVERGGTIGLVTTRVPAIGRALAFLGGRSERLALALVPLLLLGLIEIGRVWLPPRRPGSRGPGDETA